jgi:MoaA/NifB/PqqE/SkfB family radical SAM enzyme
MNYFDILIKGSEETVIKLLSSTLDADEKKAVFKLAVEIINLETSYLCNRHCDYCPVSNSTRRTDQVTMDTSLVQKIAKELAEIRYENRISLNLFNEPLLDNNLEEKIELLRFYLPWSTLTLNSNGDRLRRDRLESLRKAGLNHICVTLHPPPFKLDSKSTLINRIKKIIEKNSDNHDRDFDLNDGFLELSVSGLRLKIQWPNWRAQGTNRGGSIDNYNGKKMERTSPCVKPFREFTIFYDGDIQPCCESFHDQATQLTKISNVNNTSIFDAYASDKLASFRRSVFGFGRKTGICQFCSSVDYSKEEKDAELREQILIRSAEGG